LYKITIFQCVENAAGLSVDALEIIIFFNDNKYRENNREREREREKRKRKKVSRVQDVIHIIFYLLFTHSLF